MTKIGRSWSVIALVVVAFTIISAGQGLIQARYAAQAIIYNNLKSISNQTDLRIANTRLEVQSNLYLPLGIFLVTLGLAMLFSTVLRIGYSFLTIDQAPVKRSRRERIARFPLWLKWLGPWNLVLLLSAVGIVLGAYFVPFLPFLPVHLAVNNLYAAVTGHLSFLIGFKVIAIFFWVLLDIALKQRPQ